MELGIVVPLKAKCVSRNWEATSLALQGTLRSIANQSSRSYRAVVVGHDAPEFFADENFGAEYFSIECDPPDPSSPDFEFDHCDRDKNRKILRGMQLIDDSELTHWYYLDADDLIHREFVETVLSLDEDCGCIVNGGYVLASRFRRVVLIDNLSASCGSTSVLSARKVNVPQAVGDDGGFEEIPWCRYSHGRMAEYFETECDSKYRIFSQRLLIYHKGYGDNLSHVHRPQPLINRIKGYVKLAMKSHRITPELARDFGLEQ